MEGSEGLPLGVQIIGKCWKEEKVLAVMKKVSKRVIEDFRCPF